MNTIPTREVEVYDNVVVVVENAISGYPRPPWTHELALSGAAEMLTGGNPAVVFRVGSIWECRPIGGDLHPVEGVFASVAVPENIGAITIFDARHPDGYVPVEAIDRMRGIVAARRKLVRGETT
jgi:hypothetical protein